MRLVSYYGIIALWARPVTFNPVCFAVCKASVFPFSEVATEGAGGQLPPQKYLGCLAPPYITLIQQLNYSRSYMSSLSTRSDLAVTIERN